MANLNQELFRQLAQFLSTSPQTQTSQRDIARMILDKSTTGLGELPGYTQNAINAPVSKDEKGSGPSVLSRIIDVAMRPAYAVAEGQKRSNLDHMLSENKMAQQEGLSIPHPELVGKTFSPDDTDMLKGLSEGWKGKKKTTAGDLVRQQGNMPDNKAGAFAVGLTADVLGDPLTYVGPGAVKGAYKGVKGLMGLNKTEQAAVAAASAAKVPKSISPMSNRLISGVMEKGTLANPTKIPSAIKGFDAHEVVQTNQITNIAGGRAILGDEPTTHIVLKATEDAAKVKIALDQTAKDAAIAEHALSPMQAHQTMLSKVKDANIFLKATDSTVAAENTYKDLMKGVLYQRRGNVEQALLKHSETIKAQMKPKGYKDPVTGRFARTKYTAWPKVVKDTTKALNQHLTEPIRTLKVGETISEQSAVHGMMARVATWQGQKDLRPAALDATTGARANAERNIAALENAFKNHSDDAMLDAWKVATKAKPHDLVDGEVSKLGDVLTGTMENYFKSSAISDTAANANSVAMRSGAAMNDVNYMLKKYGIDFKFTAGKAMHPQTFKEVDYSKGTDWLNSWETKDFKDAKELKRFIFGVQSAMQQLTKEYAFVDDVAERFGHTKPSKGISTRVHHVRLGGVYFPNEIADQLSTALNTMHDFYSPKSPVMKFIAAGTSIWKTSVTKYMPSHHVRNIIGDTWLAWINGVNDPRVFGKAAKVMYAQKGRYKDLADVGELTDPNAIKNAMSKPGSVITKNKSGAKFTADQIYIAAHNYGLLQKASAIEDIMRPGLPGGIKPFGGHLGNFVSGASENREHFVKIAHFIDLVNKSKGKNYKEIFQNAAHEVRKAHPDGLDLTKEEQAFRMLVPFYSWSRKSIPLIIEGAVMNPQKAFTAPAKAQYNMQQALGIEGTSPSDPFPADQLFPSWMKERSIGPMGMTGMGGLAGMIGGAGRQGYDPETGKPIGGYTNLGFSNPLQDTMQMFGGGSPKGLWEGISSSLNPAARIPLELNAGKEAFSGVPIDDKSDYVTKQIPGVSNIARMTNLSPFGYTNRGKKEGAISGENIWNQLLGINLQGTGPYIKNAQMDLIDDQAKQNTKYREFANETGYPLKKNAKIPQWIKDLYAQQGRK